jgi:hypothetical protein
MKYYFILLPLFIIASTTLPNNLSAQESYCYYHCANFADNSTYYVYSDVANVRTSPDINSEISFKLIAGHEVMMISYKENPDEIDGMSGYWYFIKTTDGTNREGWIWSETLSCTQLRRGNTKFVFGMSKATDDNCEFTIKAIENKKIVDRKSFKSYFDVDLNDAIIMDGVKLKNVKYVVKFSFLTNGCSHAGEDEFYFAWLDETKKLIKLQKTSSFEADSESLYIPTVSNNGISNLLVKITASGIQPQNGEDAYNYEKWEYDYKTELFKWNGEKVIKINSK